MLVGYGGCFCDIFSCDGLVYGIIIESIVLWWVGSGESDMERVCYVMVCLESWNLGLINLVWWKVVWMMLLVLIVGKLFRFIIVFVVIRVM